MITIPYVSKQHVYFDDLDALNILHNVRYLIFMERARSELFDALGFDWEADFSRNPDKYHVVAAHEIRYVAPVRGTGDLSVEVTPRHLGNTSCVLSAEVRSKDRAVLHAEGKTRLVRLEPSTGRPTPWSERFRAALTPLVR